MLRRDAALAGLDAMQRSNRREPGEQVIRIIVAQRRSRSWFWFGRRWKF